MNHTRTARRRDASVDALTGLLVRVIVVGVVALVCLGLAGGSSVS